MTKVTAVIDLASHGAIMKISYPELGIAPQDCRPQAKFVNAGRSLLSHFFGTQVGIIMRARPYFPGGRTALIPANTIRLLLPLFFLVAETWDLVPLHRLHKICWQSISQIWLAKSRTGITRQFQDAATLSGPAYSSLHFSYLHRCIRHFDKLKLLYLWTSLHIHIN